MLNVGDKLKMSAHHSALNPSAMEIAALGRSSAVASNDQPWDFRSLKSNKLQHCMVQVNEGILLSEVFPKHSNLRIKVSFEPGRLGVAKVTFTVSSRPAEQQTVSLQAKQEAKLIPDIDATVSFYAGAAAVSPRNRARGLQQMERLSIKRLLEDQSTPREVIEKVSERDRQSVIACHFISNDGITAGWDEDLFERAYGTHVARQLSLLFDEDNRRHISLWFRTPLKGFEDTADFFRKNLDPFVRTFTEQKPNYHQYYNNNGELFVDIETAQSVLEVGNGMYAVDDNARQFRGIRHIPLVTKWLTSIECELFMRLAVVREHQFHVNVYANLAVQPSHIFIKKIPMFNIRNGMPMERNQLPSEQLFLAQCAMWYIRLPSRSVHEMIIPPENTRIVAYRHNPLSAGGRIEDMFYKRNEYYGIVVRVDTDNLRQTGTDFAVLMHRPRGLSALEERNGLEMLDDRLLTRFWIRVEVDEQAARRDILAAQKAFSPDATAGVQSVVDLMFKLRLGLSQGSVDASGPDAAGKNAYIDYYRSITRDGSRYPAQMTCLRAAAGQPFDCPSATRSSPYLLQIVGPGGCGKTKTEVDIIWGLHHAGKRQLAVSQGNVPVDHLAQRLFDTQPTSLRRGPVIVRVEPASLSRRQILRHQGETGMSRLDTAHIRDEPNFDDNDEIQEVMARISDDPSTIEALQFIHATGEYAEAWDAVRELQGGKLNTYPPQYSIEWHINRLLQEDFEEQLEADRIWLMANPTGSLDQPAEDRCRSNEYRRLLERYLTDPLQVAPQERDMFLIRRRELKARVFAQADIVLVTANYSAVEIPELGFEPNVIHFDEVGQSTLATFFVPLTVFTTWNKVIIYGDLEQLQPNVLSFNVNEITPNSRLSPIALLHEQKANFIFLDTQYRMAPRIADISNQLFYGGKLKTPTLMQMDHGFRWRGREVGNALAGRRMDSEFFVVSVQHGRSRPEPTGTSLQNHANANSIIFVLRRLIASGIPCESIVILGYYKGQAAVVKQKAEQAGLTYREWSTVDSYRSREADVVLVDLVVAKSTNQVPSMADSDTFGDEDSCKPGPYMTSYATDPRRLAVALTRARHVLIVFCSEFTLLGLPNSNKPEGRKKSVEMLDLARRRQLILYDNFSMDDHPDALAEAQRPR